MEGQVPKVRKLRVNAGVTPLALAPVAPVAPVGAPVGVPKKRFLRPVTVTAPAPVVPVAAPGVVSQVKAVPSLNWAQSFHFGNSLIWISQMGIQRVFIRKDWFVQVQTHDDRIVEISPVVLATRDRSYAMNYIGAVIRGEETKNLHWEMDQYDIEFARLVKQWSMD